IEDTEYILRGSLPETCPDDRGVGVRMLVEGVSGSAWNHCPDARGVGVRDSVESALCLDYAYRPLCELQRLTTNGSQRRRLRQLSVRMARQDLAPSMSFDHPQQGNQDD
ncbi:hypothetical protein M8834_25985, partial [Pseudomonas aeruginosa]|nr:hypothetical protein [Pseudomonas aeruginosa]